MKLTSDVRPDVDKLKHTGPVELGKIRAWSYSTLKVFEECPYRSYIAKVRRIAEPSGPAASRGSKIHQQAEDYVNGKLEELPDTLDGHFTRDFEQLKKLYKEGKVELEGEWGFDIKWNPVKWLDKATWSRIKLDAYVQQDEKSARVIDYKTGKKFGNEISHGQQCLLYAIGTFFRYPELEFVQAELWYLDQKSTTKKRRKTRIVR